MLKNLYVKNLALIDEAEVEFGEGLNILTGETGAGKSILLGSVNLALGAKAGKEMIRQGADYALVEMTFIVDSKDKFERLKELDVLMEDDQVVITRRFGEGRSVSKINGESVNVSTLKAVTGILIDIHGQHEHQSLLYKSNHLEILDKYAKAEIDKPKSDLKEAYKRYIKAKENLSEFTMNEEERLRECSFYQFEINEIEEANLLEGEEEELMAKHRKFTNSQKIMSAMAAVSECIMGGHGEGAADGVGRSLKEVASVLTYDEELTGIYSQLENVDALLSDLSRDITDYIDSGEFDEEEFFAVEKRLELIHKMQSKYGRTVADILEYLDMRKEKLAALENYQQNKELAEREMQTAYEEACGYAAQISAIRKKAAKGLAKEIEAGLKELNFLEVHFDVEVRELEEFNATGRDEVEFMIAVNPGESLKSLGKVASGGELSRIMLAIKNVLSDKDEVDTMIFDEIDTGISGITAQAVSEKLKSISTNRQVICITHLAQIAAPADQHFLIEKMVKDGKTVTEIRRLDDEAIILELARIIGGAQITEAVLESAREMKKLDAGIK